VENGADAFIANNDHKTALDLAREHEEKAEADKKSPFDEVIALLDAKASADALPESSLLLLANLTQKIGAWLYFLWTQGLTRFNC